MKADSAAAAPPPDPARARLLEALAALVPADEVEARHLDALLGLVGTEPACFSRATFVPGHVVGSAFVLHPPTRRVLLHLHRRLGRWLQMGGHDDGERDALATALREGREESGLTDLAPLSAAILDVDVHPIPAGKGEPPHLHFDVRWAVATARPDGIFRDDAESAALEWLGLEEAAARMDEPGATRALAKIAALL